MRLRVGKSSRSNRKALPSEVIGDVAEHMLGALIYGSEGLAIVESANLRLGCKPPAARLTE